MQKINLRQRSLLLVITLFFISLPAASETKNSSLQNVRQFKLYIESMRHWKTLMAEASMATITKGYANPIHLYFKFYHDRSSDSKKTRIEIKPISDYSKNIVALDVESLTQHDQWIYFPALHLTKKITPDPAGRFFKTALTFRDLQLLDKDILFNQYEIYLIDNQQVILQLKKLTDSSSGLYSKIVFKMDFKKPQIKEIDLFSATDTEPQRKIYNLRFSAQLDKSGSLRPLSWSVSDKQHTTDVIWEIYETNLPLNKQWFDPVLFKQPTL